MFRFTHSISEPIIIGDDHQVFIWEVGQSRHHGDGDHDHHHRHHHAKSPSNPSNKGAVPSATTRVLNEPFRAANVGGEVNQVAWSSASPDWVAVGFGRTVQ